MQDYSDPATQKRLLAELDRVRAEKERSRKNLAELLSGLRQNQEQWNNPKKALGAAQDGADQPWNMTEVERQFFDQTDSEEQSTCTNPPAKRGLTYVRPIQTPIPHNIAYSLAEPESLESEILESRSYTTKVLIMSIAMMLFLVGAFLWLITA